MPTVTLALNEHRKLDGISAEDQKKYAKFRERLETLGDESITFTWHEPRSGKHHRRFFAIVNRIFEHQEQFDDLDVFRMWLQVGGGHCSFAPGPTGKMVALPKSIAYHRLDEAEFSEVETSIMRFIRSDRATGFLWPHLSEKQREEMIDTIIREFE